MAKMNSLASKANLDSLSSTIDKVYRFDTEVAVMKAERALFQ
jgi:hypothetical protein